MKTKRLAILGAGHFGQLLGTMWSQPNDDYTMNVTLWNRSPEKNAVLQQILPSSICIESELSSALLNQQTIIVFAATSSGTLSLCQKLGQLNLSKDIILLNVSKGLIFPECQYQSHIMEQYFPHNPIAILSGPSLAQELLEKKPTAVCIASKDEALSKQLMQWLSRENWLRIYANTDVLGVELGGALKNIYAIAAGYLSTCNLGDNAKAAFLTRALAEMARFALQQGAMSQTLYGLSGLGDLLTTCNSPLSRNFQLGSLLASGLTLNEATTQVGSIVEGVHTTNAVVALAKQQNIEMPIANAIHQALTQSIPAELLIRSLMGRKLKAELS